MIHKYQEIYLNMLTEIDKCWQTCKADKEKAENCFWMAHHYCNRIKELASTNGFSSDQEEIDFFRDVKPRFTCFLDFYVILSESLMFVPKEPQPALDFWNEESKRFERFCHKNHLFISYFESGCTHLDDEYFLRRNIRPELLSVSQSDGNKDYCTNYDMILGNYLAQKKYLEYIVCRKNLLNLPSGDF